VRLKLEFSTEPFDLEELPAHAVAARRVVDEADLAVEVGPFGTSAEGEAGETLAAVSRLLRECLEAGASRVSLQVSVLDAASGEGTGK
jgi:uncharacterized protein YqgV (UPF0045/DUF77 family)